MSSVFPATWSGVLARSISSIQGLTFNVSISVCSTSSPFTPLQPCRDKHLRVAFLSKLLKILTISSGLRLSSSYIPRVENLLRGQSKCSTPIPPNQFPSRYNFSKLWFLKSPAATHVFDKFTSLRLRFCSRTQRNSFAHRDFSLTPVMSSDLTVEFHPKEQASRHAPEMSRLYTRRVLFSADIRGVAVIDFESKIVNSFRVEFTSIILDSSSAPLDPIESSHICNSSKLVLSFRAEASIPAPCDPIPDSDNIISLMHWFFLKPSASSHKHSTLNLFLLNISCLMLGLFSSSILRSFICCSSHSTR